MSALNPFAQVDNLINQAVQGHLANAVASYKGGPAFGVLFTRAGDDPFDGALDATACTCSFVLARTPNLTRGDELVIDSVPYVVSAPVQPDASGWVRITLHTKD